MPLPRLAIVGTGIAGLGCAYFLRERFDLTLFEQADHVGGHTNTIDVTAAALGQAALEKTELGHGVFTSALIDALYNGDVNGDGLVSLSEVVTHVQDLVPRLIRDPEVRKSLVKRGQVGGVQSARFGGRGEDFPLARRLQP